MYKDYFTQKLDFKMKLKTKTLALFILVLPLLFTTKTSAQSLLWKISGNGLKKPSYVYGTIHLICPTDLTVSDAVKDAFDKTEQLVLELDMDAPGFMQKMQQQSVNPDMKNIRTLLNEEETNILNNFFQKHYNANLAQLGILKPFVLQTMILAKTLDCAQPGSYEGAFIQLTKEQQEETFGLEEVEEQMAIFDNIPNEKQIKWLVEYAKEFDNTKEELRELLEAYNSENLDAIMEITSKNPEYKDFLDILLTNRNKNWISKIRNYAAQKPSIFAVGAAHLPGENGVLKLLEKEGYTITPVQQ